MIKEMIGTINYALCNDEMTFDCARELLKSLSKLTGKEYMIIKRRVAFKEDGKIHDAWVYA